MNPHEETWYEAHGDVFVQVGQVRGGDDHLVMYGDNRGPRKKLITAAPRMARALLRMLAGTGCRNTGRSKRGCADAGLPECDVCEARAALRAGGAL